MSTEIAFHGGHCCGIKTIHNFIGNPSMNLSEKKETDKYTTEDREGGGPESAQVDFFWPARPQETATERFDAQIEFLEKVRHYGLVECAICVPTGGQTLPSLGGDTAYALETGAIPTYDEAVAVAKEVYEDNEWADEDYYEDSYSHDQSAWEPVFLERGFRMVSEFPNINSGNMIRVYHLVMDGAYYKAKKDK